jgi:hypothetical protein
MSVVNGVTGCTPGWVINSLAPGRCYAAPAATGLYSSSYAEKKTQAQWSIIIGYFSRLPKV